MVEYVAIHAVFYFILFYLNLFYFILFFLFSYGHREAHEGFPNQHSCYAPGSLICVLINLRQVCSMKCKFSLFLLHKKQKESHSLRTEAAL